MPEIDVAKYRLHVRGLVEEERSFTWEEIMALPASKVNARLTSVSGWSVRATGEGVFWRDFIYTEEPGKCRKWGHRKWVTPFLHPCGSSQSGF